MSKRQLYALVILLGFAGQVWIIYSYHKLGKGEEAFNTCIFRRVTGIPCPSCGTIHSIVSILHGDFVKAFKENPLGYAGLLIVAVLPFWALADLASGRRSLYSAYLGTETLLRKKWFLVPFLVFIAAVWTLSLLHHFLILP